MGNRVGAFIARPFRNFNIDNRVQKVVGAEKPKPAPRHPSDQKYEAQVAVGKLARFIYENFVSRPKGSFVTPCLFCFHPYNPTQQPEPEKTERALPQSRQSWQQYQYGYYEPQVVRPGRITLRQATQLILDAAADPSKFTPEALASQYALKVEDVRSVLKYFRAFQVYTPQVNVAERLGVQKVKSMLGLAGAQPEQTQSRAKALLE
ncbi:unnamed protein product, partial [Ixodes hexagonus]